MTANNHKARGIAIIALCLLCATFLAAQQPAYSMPVRELQSFRKNGSGDLWRNVVVSPKIKREQLVAIARELHKADPMGRIRIFTDDAEFEAFMLRDINYPDPAYTYPEKWANKHYIAQINKTGVGGGVTRWTLSPMSIAGTKLLGVEIDLK